MFHAENEHTYSSYHSLKNLYAENITVQSIAQQLEHCSLDDSAPYIKKELEKKNFDILGVMDGGEMVGYIEKQELAEGRIADYLKPFSTKDLVSDSTPLIQILYLFKEKDRLFVLENNFIKKLVTQADFQKPPIRMLIFGYITLLEMRLSDIIIDKFNDDSWSELISGERLTKAHELYVRRLEKNEDINLVECLQISDKLGIIRNDDELRGFFQIPSKSKGKKDAQAIRKLRDQISHANELGLDMPWEEIIEVVQLCGHFLELSEAYPYD